MATGTLLSKLQTAWELFCLAMVNSKTLVILTTSITSLDYLAMLYAVFKLARRSTRPIGADFLSTYIPSCFISLTSLLMKIHVHEQWHVLHQLELVWWYSGWDLGCLATIAFVLRKRVVIDEKLSNQQPPDMILHLPRNRRFRFNTKQIVFFVIMFTTIELLLFAICISTMESLPSPIQQVARQRRNRARETVTRNDRLAVITFALRIRLCVYAVFPSVLYCVAIVVNNLSAVKKSKSSVRFLDCFKLHLLQVTLVFVSPIVVHGLLYIVRRKQTLYDRTNAGCLFVCIFAMESIFRITVLLIVSNIRSGRIKRSVG